MAGSVLRVDLLGESFSLTVAEDEQYIQTVYKMYRTLLDSTQKATGMEKPARIALVAGLQLYDEIMKLREKQNSGEAVLESLEAERRFSSVIKKLDKMLAGEAGGGQNNG